MSSMSKEDAQKAVLDNLNPHPELSKFDDEIAIDPSVFYETKYSWIFSCNSKRYLETGNRLYRLLGLRLVAVEKQKGRVYPIGTGYSDRVLIALHESMFYPTIINRVRYKVLVTLYYLGIQL